jgi:NADH dehydrogenase
MPMQVAGNPSAAAPTRVVILGAGFGGLTAAQALAAVDVDVTVIDRQNHHCFQPLLYQVATAALSPADVAWPIRHILSRQRNTTVQLAEVQGIDATARVVITEGGNVPYDLLVIATGSMHAYFGHDEWATVAPGLKGIDHATLMRRRILTAFEQAESTGDEAERQRLLSFVIVGGGPTGVEMAGALAEIARQTLPPDFRRIDTRTARIRLIEAGPRILPTFREELSAYTKRVLERMGVEVLVNSAVTECSAAGVAIGARVIDASTIIWAAGVVASPAARWLGAKSDRAGRVIVERDLSVPGHPEVFVIGDTAAVAMEAGRNVPGLAPAAKQMGRYVARVIAARVAGVAPPAEFRYHHEGDLATIGWRKAVVQIGRWQLRGWLGWAFWCLAHVYFLIGLRSRFFVAASWAWQYLTFQRGARLITGRDSVEGGTH